MYSKRGGRVQVNMMQYHELVARVDKLEAQNKPKEVEQPKEIIIDEIVKDEIIIDTIETDEVEKIVLTKNEAMALLDEKGIKYNPRDKKDILIGLLNKEV